MQELQQYLRRWSRRDVNLPAKVKIILNGGKVFSSGTAIVKNISLHGALLSKILIKGQVLPAQNFKIQLLFDMKKYRGVGAVARPVHFGKANDFQLGIEFEDLWVGSKD